MFDLIFMLFTFHSYSRKSVYVCNLEIYLEYMPFWSIKSYFFSTKFTLITERSSEKK